VREQAEAEKRALHADIRSMGDKQRALLDDIRALAARLEQMATEAAARFPPGEPAEPAEGGMQAPEAGAEAESTEVGATDARRSARGTATGRRCGEWN
jgi:hypothetical protein